MTGPITPLLLQKNVVINAHPIDEGQPLWQTLLFGFGSTLLHRRPLRPAAGGRRPRPAAARWAGSAARGRSATTPPRPRSRWTSRTSPGSTRPRTSWSRSSTSCATRALHASSGRWCPRGVLLSGPPGTGKTLLARAVAGEAGVPFFSLSASEFIEAIVGVGASRVRDLFAQAKAAAPAIIFIDELDAIGRARGGGATPRRPRRARADAQPDPDRDGRLLGIGGRDRDRVDEPARGARLGAASPRPVRPPRDREPARPDRPQADPRGAHPGVPLADDVDLQAIASTTPGMVGADLRNLVNEAALMAARRGHEQRAARRLHRLAREDRARGRAADRALPAERERTAYHESGHALLGMLQPGADPVRKISIIPRGRALGVTFQSPESDRYGYSADYLRGRLIGSLGGRAAELLIYGDLTTGAESDLEQATRIARMMAGPVGHVGRGRAGVRPARAERRADALPRRRRAVGADARAGGRRGPPDPRRVRRRRARRSSASTATSSRR